MNKKTKLRKRIKREVDRAAKRDPEVIRRLLDMAQGFQWQAGRPSVPAGNATSTGDAGDYLALYEVISIPK
jgi:hypothetical protein